MEHRLANRYTTDCAVDIFQGHRCIVQGVARNVSQDGALLEAEALPWPCHGHIQLELRTSDPASASRRLRGVVIHRDDQKLGVMLLDSWNSAEWRALTDACPGAGSNWSSSAAADAA